MQNTFVRLATLSLLATVTATVTACGGDGSGTDVDAGTDTAADTDGGATDTTGDSTGDGSGSEDTSDDTVDDTSTDTSDTSGDGSGAGDTADDTSTDTDTADATTDGSGAGDAGGDTSDTCGNGTIDDGEQCDGTALGGFDCSGVGFTTGTLACASDCTFDTADCSNGPGCGDGIEQDGEECDDDNLADGDGCSSLCTVCADDASEPNFDIENATALPYGADTTGLVAQSGNEDWYLIDVAPGCRATFNILTADPSLLEANIIDVDGATLGTSDITDTGIRIDYFEDDGGFSAGTFVVRIRPVSAAACVPYTFSSAEVCG